MWQVSVIFVPMFTRLYQIPVLWCGVSCETVIETHDRTGVEMEALMAVQVALLTIYDMCKAVDNRMSITNVKLVSKTKQ